MILKECIKKARERAGMTQEEASVVLDVSTQTIANWENGRAKPDSSIYNKIATAYNIDVVELIEALSFEIQNENQENTTGSQELKFADILPADLNFDKLKDFTFTELEQEAFLIIASYAEFDTSPIDKLISLTDNILTICSVLDKLRKYNLYYSYYNPIPPEEYRVTDYNNNFTLSPKGKEVFKIIKHNRSKLFSIYNLSFIDLLNILGLYKIMDTNKLKQATKIMNNISTDGLLLETYNYSEQYNTWKKRYLDNHMKWSEQNYYHSSYTYEYVIKELLELDFYEIVEFELEDKLYCIEKEAYIKKTEFYNQNKDNYEDLKEPKAFEALFAKKVVLTQKGLKFWKEINNSFTN